jgi:hypothetical protein
LFVWIVLNWERSDYYAYRTNREASILRESPGNSTPFPVVIESIVGEITLFQDRTELSQNVC